MSKKHLTIKSWITKAGYKAVILQHVPDGNLPTELAHLGMNFQCGYVAVPSEHPLFGKHWDATYSAGIDVHGGMTYSSEVAGSGNYPESYENLWWFGYDCGHYQDSPSMQDTAYNIAECESLATQLLKLTTPS